MLNDRGRVALMRLEERAAFKHQLGTFPDFAAKETGDKARNVGSAHKADQIGDRCSDGGCNKAIGLGVAQLLI